MHSTPLTMSQWSAIVLFWWHGALLQVEDSPWSFSVALVEHYELLLQREKKRVEVDIVPTHMTWISLTYYLLPIMHWEDLLTYIKYIFQTFTKHIKIFFLVQMPAFHFGNYLLSFEQYSMILKAFANFGKKLSNLRKQGGNTANNI